MTDLQLLRDYAHSRSQEAFAQLAARHADWVYSLAVRRLSGDAHLAEDVTQAVFLLLAQKAGTLTSSEVALNAWLFKTAQYACANALRMKMRREKHEKRAAEMSAESRDAQHDQTWEKIAPNLERMVERLRAQDRDVLLLRFYQRKSMAEVGQALGISEDAAKKRVARAVEALRENFEGAGIAASAEAIAAPLLIKTTQAAPAKLIALCAAPGAVKTAGTLGIAKGALFMATMKTKLAVAGVIVGSLTLATGVAVVIVQPWKPLASALPAATVSITPAAPTVTSTLSKMPATSVAGGYITKMGTGQLVPSSPKTRPPPDVVAQNRVKCAANLKMIGNGLLLYANEHKGVYPPDLGTLARDEDMTLAPFVCPAVGKSVPDALSMSLAQRADWVNANTDYHYIPGFNTSTPSDTVIAYEDESDEYGDGVNMLFGDGHVEFRTLDQSRPLIESSTAAAARGGAIRTK